MLHAKKSEMTKATGIGLNHISQNILKRILVMGFAMNAPTSFTVMKIGIKRGKRIGETRHNTLSTDCKKACSHVGCVNGLSTQFRLKNKGGPDLYLRAPIKTGKEQGLKVSYGEGLTTHTNSESCVISSNAYSEALTRESAG